MRLIMVRYDETVWNAERRLQGHTDAPLSPRGTKQARQAASFFAGGPVPSLVLASATDSSSRLPSTPSLSLGCSSL